MRGRRHPGGFWALFALGVSLILALGGAARVEAAVQAAFVVNATGDAIDVSPGDGVCATLTGQCTLRAAVNEANTRAGADTITFAINGTFQLTLAGASENAALNGDLDVTDDLTITGNGRTATIVDGGGTAVNDRVFHVDPLGTGTHLSLSRLTVQHGNVAGAGGGILDDAKATLSLDDVAVRDNNASTRDGGISNESNYNVAALTNVAIIGNRADDVGGLGNEGIVTMTDTTVANNTAESTGGLFLGGIATLTRVTVSGNRATGAPALFIGGIEAGGTVTIVNSTISGNYGDPGAIWNGFRSKLTNVTISDNTGGIRNCDNCPGSSIELTNTILAKSAFFPGVNCEGTITSRGHNLDDGAGCGFSAALGDLVNANPALGPLAKNGGRTETHAVPSGSPAVDAGDATQCPGTTQ
jgi:CSLREA domain-containing protein